MGGHGGLNILPQKRWNVYNFDNREKVRKDEEAAAKEEQLHREEVRRLEAGVRLNKLREAHGSVPSPSGKPAATSASSDPEKDSNHINLFQGLKDFGVIGEANEDARIAREKFCKKMRVKKEEPKVLTPEDEKYKLGYGIAGKGVKLPWYLAKPNAEEGAESGGGGRHDGGLSRLGKEGVKAGGKKSLQELREERVKRERQEKVKAQNLLREKNRTDGGFSKGRDFSRRMDSSATKTNPWQSNYSTGMTTDGRRDRSPSSYRRRYH